MPEPFEKIPEVPKHVHETLKFPDGFLWGTALSAHQHEGNNQHSDWWAWEQKPGNPRSGDAVNHYALYEADFDLAKSLHQNAHRFSLEWSRLEPHEGEWDTHEVEHYQNVLRALKARGFAVALTLHHFTNPAWFANKGGWERRDAPRLFERYVDFAIKNFGEWVDLWLTVNEPQIYAAQSYALGVWPPQKRSVIRAWRVLKNLARAHRAAYAAIHKAMDTDGKKAQVGFAHGLMSMVAYRKHSLLDHLALRIADKIWNHSFYDLTKGTHDFLGVNYYLHQRVKRAATKLLHNFVDPREENREVSDMGWEIYPQGIFEALLDVKDMNLPIYITENGISTANDDRRARFIVSYIKELYHAIHAGIDVRGYFHWSLLDNFEWDKGYTQRFGLVEVDFKTLKRMPRPSAALYAQICKENGIPHDLLRYVGHAVEEH
ncbi:MAG: glycoside hydrolase family 1 protein [Patescibacteria group bacterium]